MCLGGGVAFNCCFNSYFTFNCWQGPLVAYYVGKLLHK